MTARGIGVFFIVLMAMAWQPKPAVGQPMLKKLHQQNGRVNPAIGFRAGEPMGINIQFYKGIMDSNTKSKGLFDINLAKEGAVMSLKQPYKTGEWRPGGTRYSVSWFHEVNHRLFSHYFYYGIGLQAGTRNYQQSANHFSDFAWGPQLTVHGELPVKNFSIRPHGLYCKISLFVEVIYHKEFGEEFEYLKPAGGVRLNWFY